ncbi:hypothetical protein RRG08_052321 [Elysia crispata]|uniref:Uncharacterized protein n=1 Tax=Elysia crispata TaxID=231223 RepID=A0AAE1AJ31_9GAST|nr:hypothetical protein RRG08_052321 [Elysia crispata]
MEDSESDSGRRSHLAVSTLDTKTAGNGEKRPRGTPWRARKTQRVQSRRNHPCLQERDKNDDTTEYKLYLECSQGRNHPCLQEDTRTMTPQSTNYT